MNKLARQAFMTLSICLIIATLGCGSQAKKDKAIVLKVEHFGKAQGLASENITTVAAFANKIWAGTKEGLLSYDGVNWHIRAKKNTNALSSNIIEKLKSSNNILWISTDGGVCKFDGNNMNSVFTGGRARSACGQGSQIAVATAHGVEYSSGGSFRALDMKSASLVYDEVSEIAFDAQGKLWAGTRAGMAQISSGVAQNYTGPAKTVMGSSLIDVPAKPSNCKLIGNNIKVIIPYNGMLAIGTTSGLSITDMQNSWTNYYSAHKEWAQVGGKIVQNKVSGNSPLPGNIIRSLATTSNNELLFVGTDKGLAIMRDNTWLDYSKIIKGIPSTNITGLAVLKDDLWVGTPKGLYLVKDITSLIKTTKP